MNLKYGGNVFATATASWLYPFKKMNVVVVGEKLYAAFNDYDPKEKLKYYERAIQGRKYHAPKYDKSRPLTEQVKHFIECVKKNKEPLTNGHHALEITKILEACSKSIKTGSAINLNSLS